MIGEGRWETAYISVGDNGKSRTWIGVAFCVLTRLSSNKEGASMLRKLISVVTVFALLITTGCATVIRGTQQVITVNSDPPGAKVAVRDSKGRTYETSTPGSVKLPRKDEGITVIISKEGYQSASVGLTRTTAPGWTIFGNILLAGGIIGLLVDFATGAARQLQPTAVSASLTKMGANLDQYPDLFLEVSLKPDTPQSHQSPKE